MGKWLAIWTNLSLVKRLLIAAAFGFILVFAVWIVGSFFGIFTSWHDRKFDKTREQDAQQQQVYKQQIDELTLERATAITRAEAAEKEAGDLKAQVAITETALATAGAKVQDANRKLTDEDARYTQDLASSGADVDPCERYKHNCETAKRLGIKSKSAPCNCD
jgi:predicted lipid-binding transport protein (Tim44 family)